MIKKWKAFLTVICLWFGFTAAIHASAAESLVYDNADLLTVEEEASLQQYAEIYKETWGMNFLVVTTADVQGKSSMEYADDFYDAKFPEASEEDGVLYLIDMDNREIYLSTCGKAIGKLTDAKIDKILDAAYAYVSDGDYYGTFVAFFEETEEQLQPRRITLGEAVVAFVAALAAAGITMGVIKAKYQLKFEDFHYDAYTDAQVYLSVKTDQLTNRIVTHRRIPKDSGSSGGGGSSTHTSSSGRSHGGGGRSF